LHESIKQHLLNNNYKINIYIYSFRNTFTYKNM